MFLNLFDPSDLELVKPHKLLDIKRKRKGKESIRLKKTCKHVIPRFTAMPEKQNTRYSEFSMSMCVEWNLGFLKNRGDKLIVTICKNSI